MDKWNTIIYVWKNQLLSNLFYKLKQMKKRVKDSCSRKTKRRKESEKCREGKRKKRNREIGKARVGGGGGSTTLAAAYAHPDWMYPTKLFD